MSKTLASLRAKDPVTGRHVLVKDLIEAAQVQRDTFMSDLRVLFPVAVKVMEESTCPECGEPVDECDCDEDDT